MHILTNPFDHFFLLIVFFCHATVDFSQPHHQSIAMFRSTPYFPFNLSVRESIVCEEEVRKWEEEEEVDACESADEF